MDKKLRRQQNIKQMIVDLESALQNDNQNEEIQKLKDNHKMWLQKVQDLIISEKYDLAEQMFYGVLLQENGQVNTYWLATESAIMDLMFKIHKKEQSSGYSSIFKQFQSLDGIVDFYYDLKFLVRRFEYDFSDELKEELLPFITRFSLSEFALAEMVRASALKPEKVYNELAIFLMQHELYDYVIPLLAEAYSLNPSGKETLFNLSYILYCLGEVDLAKEYMNQIKEETERNILERMINVECKPLDYQEIYTMQWGQDVQEQELVTPEKTEKIAFIICANKEKFLRECRLYIEMLNVPKGYEIEIIPIHGAKSITEGYQKGMKSSDARYKIYLHQDAMCIHKNMLYEAIRIFQSDSQIGLIGVAGCIEMPETGIWWEADMETSYYNLAQDSVASCGCDNYNRSSKIYGCGDYQYVTGLDGVFLMTAYDLDWREDLFDGWHIYDVSQTMEFVRHGYKVVVPKMDQLWIMHCEKYQTHLEREYHVARLQYLKEYYNELVE